MIIKKCQNDIELTINKEETNLITCNDIKFSKVNLRRGVSLILLVITIIIIIIISSTVVMTFSDNNIIDSATEATFKSNLSTYSSTLEMHKFNELINDYNYDPSKLNANSTVVTYDGKVVEGKNIYDIIDNLDKDDTLKHTLEIKEGKLVYVGENKTHQKWAEDIIEVGLVYIDVSTLSLENSIELDVKLSGAAINDDNILDTIIEYSLDGKETYITDNITTVENKYVINDLPKGYKVYVKVIVSVTKAGETIPYTTKEETTSAIEYKNQLEEYIIEYNANKGESEPESQLKTEGTDLVLSSSKPIREGYIFLGWSNKSDGEVIYNPGDKYSLDADITLYAVWELISVDASNLNITITPESPSKEVKFTVTNIPDDITLIQYKLPNTDVWIDYNKGQEISITDNGTLEIKISNIIGTSDILTKEITNIDKTAPSDPTYTLSTEDWTNGNVILTVTYSEDNSSKQYKLGSSGEWTNYTQELTIENNNTIYLKETDSVGNSSSEVTVVIDNIDKVLPTAPSISGYTSGIYTNDDVELTFSSTDSDSGISSYEYKIGENGNYVTTTSPLILEDEMSDNVYIRAKDKAGNYSEASTITINIDFTAPNAPTYELSTTSWTSGNVTLTATFSEEGSSKQYKIGSTGEWTTYTQGLTIENNNTIYLKETDSVGNESATVEVVVDNIDKVLPTAPSISGYTSGTYTNDDVELTFSSTDASSGISSYEYKIGESGTYEITTSPLTLTDEMNDTVYIRAKDTAGNYSEVSTTIVKIDKTSPSDPTYTVSTTNWTNANVIITPTNAGSITNQYKLGNSGEWTTYTTATIEIISNNTVYLKSIDEAGNESNEVNVVVDNIDKILPTVSLNPSSAIATKSVTVTVTGSDEGGSNVSDIKYIWSTSSTKLATTDTSWSSATAITSGDTTTKSYVTDTYYLHTLVTDGAGNVSSSVSGSYVIDNTTPDSALISATFNPTGFTNGNIEVTITGITADMSIIEYISPDVTEFTSLPSDNKITVTENGSIILNISDTAGNSSTKTIQITNIDKVAPTCAISTSDITDTSFTITATAADAAATTTNANSGISKYEFYVNDSLVSTQTSTATTASYDVTGKTGSTAYTCKVIVTDGASNTVTESSSLTTAATPQPLSIVNPGDYVTYDSGTDYTGDWIVLYDGTSEGNGNRVEIISAESTEDVSLGSYTASVAKTSYANVIDILNTYAAGYLNSTYTDRARSVGSDPSDPDSYGSISESLIYYGSTSSELWQTHYTTDTTALKSIDFLNISGNYWLASRTYYYFEDLIGGYINFKVNYVDNSIISETSPGIYRIFTDTPSTESYMGDSYVRGFRPVVSIKSSIVITGGRGTSSDPYILSQTETNVDLNGYTAGEWTNQDIDVTLTALNEDTVGFQYSIDNGTTWVNCDSSFSITSDQDSTYIFREYNANNEYSSATIGYNIKRDTIAPEIDITLYGEWDYGTYTLNINSLVDNLSGFANDSKMDIYIKGYNEEDSEYTLYNSISTSINEYEIIDSYNGYCTVKVIVYDAAGNQSYSIDSDYSGCFVAGTQVLTEDGYANIEDIKVGDVLYTINEDTNEYELKTVTIKYELKADEIYEITVGDELIKTTPAHQFYVEDKGLVSACNLSVGDKLLSFSDEETNLEITNINNIKYDSKEVKVYNMTVEDNHNYVITLSDILVHNVNGVEWLGAPSIS